ncbi:RNA polymerase sigma factor [Planctomycetota bacterium]
MKRRNQTDLGGTLETFLTTHWSLIENIQRDEDPDRALVGLLLQRYWKPVYCYLRRKGCDNEQAKDLTQDFFYDVVLSRQLIQRADPSKGRFRSFLLHAVKQYVIDARRRENAQKHIPKEKLVPLDINDPPILPQTISNWSPEDCFIYAWKSAILEETLAEVQSDCLSQGLETHWHVFQDRILQPALQNDEPPSMGQICTRYGIVSETTASNMIVTVKRRFRTAMRKHLRSTVLSDEEADEELLDMLKTWDFSAQDGC